MHIIFGSNVFYGWDILNFIHNDFIHDRSDLQILETVKFFASVLDLCHPLSFIFDFFYEYIDRCR